MTVEFSKLGDDEENVLVGISVLHNCNSVYYNNNCLDVIEYKVARR